MEHKILAIYDNPKYIDRYTVYIDCKETEGNYTCLSMANDLNTFCQHSLGRLGRHNGKKISYNSLPQSHQDLLKEYQYIVEE